MALNPIQQGEPVDPIPEKPSRSASGRSPSMFDLRHHADLSFEKKVGNKSSTYFRDDGSYSTENINKVGDIVILSINKNNEGEDAMELPVDDKAARVARLEHFEAACESHSGVKRFGDLTGILLEDEEVIITLECSEISGLPSTTSAISFVRGKISVSLVKSTKAPGGGFRLLFHVSEGSRDITVDESFVEMTDQNQCVMCFKNVGRCCCYGFHSSMAIEYSAIEVQLDTFFTLPLHSALVDSSCYVSSQDEFKVLTGKDDSSEAGPCCSPFFKCPPCPIIPMCCALIQQWGMRSILFHAYEERSMGDEHKSETQCKLENSESIEDGKGLTWNMTRKSHSDVYVVVHYRNLLDKAVHHCKMRVIQTQSASASDEAFQTAKRFVSLVTGFRDRFTESQPAAAVVYGQGDNRFLLDYAASSWNFQRPPRSSFRYYRPLVSGGYELVVAVAVTVGFRDGAEWFDAIANGSVRCCETCSKAWLSPLMAKKVKTAFEKYLCNSCARPAFDLAGTAVARTVNTIAYSSLHWALKTLIAAITGGTLIGVVLKLLGLVK